MKCAAQHFKRSGVRRRELQCYAVPSDKNEVGCGEDAERTALQDEPEVMNSGEDG
jgi:hypothetical protein